MNTVHSTSRTQRESGEHSVAQLFGNIADLAVLASIVLVPFCLGGRIAIGQFVLLSCAVVAALAWSGHLLCSRRPTWTAVGVEPLLIGGLALGLIQLTPLPSTLLTLLSPQHAKILPMWMPNGGAGLPWGPWQTLSLDAAETRSALIVGLSYVLLFYVATQRIRCLADVERLLKFIAVSSAAMAVFGVVQWLSNNGKFFWFFDYPLTSPEHRMKGAFTNKNHFAQFLVLGCGPLLWWIMQIHESRTAAVTRFGDRGRSGSDNDTVLGGLLLVLGVVIFAVLFSLSRGGVVALGVSLCVMLVTLFCIGKLSGRMLASMLGMAGVAACLFVMLGYEKVNQRLEHWKSDSRLEIWQANLQVTGHFPLFGSGLGSHAEAYPLFFDPPFAETEFTHAENSYLQIASECGLLGLLMLVISVSCCARWCWRGLRVTNNPRIQAIAAAITASLAANAIHACVDFVWYVPGLVTTVLALAACARRVDQLSADAREPAIPATVERTRGAAPRGLGLIAAAATIAIGLWAAPPILQAVQAEPDWFEYLRLTLRAPDGSTLESENESETESETESDAALDDPIARFKQRVASLNRVTKLNPEHARAHTRLATLYLSAFDELQKKNENPMSLAQLRDAAAAAPFGSTDELREWLQRAVGPNLKYLDAAAEHSQQALRLCPLQAPAYVHLADLAFLDSRDPTQSRRLLEQARLVRPHSAQVQFVVGREAFLEGHTEEAVKSWKNAFHQQRTYQNRILDLLVGSVPPNVILTEFDPDLTVLGQLEVRYRNFPAQHRQIAQAYAERLRSDAAHPECTRPVDQLMTSAALFAAIQLPSEAELCFRRAIEFDSSSVAAHRKYGLFLLQQGQAARAAEQLQAALRLNPGDSSLRREAELAVASSLKSDSGIQLIEHRRPKSDRQIR